MTFARPHPLLFSALLHMREVQGMPLVSLTALHSQIISKSSQHQMQRRQRPCVALIRWDFLTTSKRTKSSGALTNHNNYITASPPLPIVPELLLEAFQLVLHVCAPAQLAVQLKSVKSLRLVNIHRLVTLTRYSWFCSTMWLPWWLTCLSWFFENLTGEIIEWKKDIWHKALSGKGWQVPKVKQFYFRFTVICTHV